MRTFPAITFPLTRQSLTALVVTAFLFVGCSSQPSEPESAATAAPAPEGTPKLVLLVVIDQMRADYIDRFRDLFVGGLDRLLDESIHFVDAHQSHASTSTSPGHATIVTGVPPRIHGIVGNGWYDRTEKRSVYSADDEEHGRSPKNLLVPTLGDLLKERYPDARVFSLGGKDRSAILTAAHDADGVYWYESATGNLVTSSYYDDIPGWLEELNERQELARHYGTLWEPLLPLSEVAEYDIEPLDRGLFTSRFPYSFGGPAFEPDRRFFSSVYGTPFIDEHMVNVALELIAAEQLGQDDSPDFLAVNLSALDSVGHGYGPHSHEMLDTLLRADRWIGALLDGVDEQIGLDQVVVALSSDHGVGVVPEMAVRRGETGGRFGAQEALCFQHVGQALEKEFGEGPWMESSLYLDHALAQSREVDLTELRRRSAELVGSCPLIAEVLLPDDLSDGTPDAFTTLFYNSYHADRSGDLLVRFEPNVLTSSTTASHGSPYSYDTHVPWLLRLPSGQPSIVTERAHTYDIAPTLAQLLDVEHSEFVGTSRLP